MQDFRNLKVWEKAHALTLQVYSVTSSFPQSELFGLTSQMRRSAASIPTNLAEGCGRTGNAELIRFARIAMGSASELEYQVLLCQDLPLISPETYRELNVRIAEVKKMLASLVRGMRQVDLASSNGIRAKR
jgi:four helix bundle protein